MKNNESTSEERITRLEERLDELFTQIHHLQAFVSEPIVKPNTADQTSPTKDEAINDIMENFDFAKVYKIMVDYNWVWFDRKTQKTRVPTLEEIKDNARELLERAWDQLNETEYDYSGWKEIFVETGGFNAWVCECGKDVVIPERHLKLRFILEEWECGKD